MSSIRLSIARALSAAEAEKVRSAEKALTLEWSRWTNSNQGTWTDFWRQKARPVAVNELFDELGDVGHISMTRSEGVYLARDPNPSFVRDIHRHFQRNLSTCRSWECTDRYVGTPLQRKGRENPSRVAFKATVYQGLNREELDYIKAHPDEFKQYWDQTDAIRQKG